jgi:hypothetical protein
MQSIGHVQMISPSSASGGVWLTGDLKFQQRDLLPAWQMRTRYNVPVVNYTLGTLQPDVFTWKSILGNYHARDGSLMMLTTE